MQINVKKTLSILLILTMIFSLITAIPLTAGAAVVTGLYQTNAATALSAFGNGNIIWERDNADGISDSFLSAPNLSALKQGYHENSDGTSYLRMFEYPDDDRTLGTGELFINGTSFTHIGDAMWEINNLLYGTTGSDGVNVEVTGSWAGIVGYYLEFSIPAGKTLTWRAIYSGKLISSSLIYLEGKGKLVVGNGGSIDNSGDNSATLFATGTSVIINNGGIVSNTGNAIDFYTTAIFGISDANVTLNTGGMISASGTAREDLTCFALRMQPGTFTNNGGTTTGVIFVLGIGELFVNGIYMIELADTINLINGLLFSGEDVEVTGLWSGINNVYASIDIPVDRTLTWRASYSGNTDTYFLLNFYGEGTFIIGEGGLITNSGVNSGTIYTEGVEVVVNSGGTIANTGNAAEEDVAAIVGIDANVTLNSGTIVATGTQEGDSLCYALYLNNGTFTYISGTIIGVVSPKASQPVLTINDPGKKTYGVEPFQLTSTGGGGVGVVTYSLISGPATVTSEGMVTITGIGSVVVQAAKAGDDYYNDAVSIEFIIIVNEPTSGGDFILGDVNGSGTLTITDVTMIYQHVRGKTLLSGGALVAADVNRTGTITISDVTMLYQYVRGKISSF